MRHYHKKKNDSLSRLGESLILLKIAGAIIMGKTETTELAYFHPGKTTNPHDYSKGPPEVLQVDLQQQWQHYMAPLSIGSQTNGSTIRPASYCGVVGYKPSYGLNFS